MRAKIPAKYIIPENIADVIADVLRANNLNPLVTIRGYAAGTIIETAEATLSGAVKTQIKNAVLPLLIDTTTDADITG